MFYWCPSVARDDGKSTGSGLFERGVWCVCVRWRKGDVIEGLGLNLVPYHSVQSAGSAAVSKLKLTGSAVATFTAICEPRKGPAVIRGLNFMSSVFCQKNADVSTEKQLSLNKNVIMHLLIWECLLCADENLDWDFFQQLYLLLSEHSGFSLENKHKKILKARISPTTQPAPKLRYFWLKITHLTLAEQLVMF